MPQSPWKDAAPFPEPDEELYGAAGDGKLYVIGGFGGGKGRGANYSYDPVANKWKQGKSMPRPAHHAALAFSGGKVYVFGGFVAPEAKGLPPAAAWEPVDNAWEYDPAADSWRALPPMPGRCGAAVAVEVGGKIHVIGGATTVENSPSPFFTMLGPCRVLATNVAFDTASGRWEERRPMAVPRNHAFAGAVGGKIYVIGGRTGHGFVTSASNTDAVEEYDPATDLWSLPKSRMPTARSGGGWGTDGRRVYVAGGEVTTNQLAGTFRAVEAYEPATDTWALLPPMKIPRHGVAGGVIGGRLHLVSGMVQTAGAMTMFDPKLEVHTAAHHVLDLSGVKPSAEAPPAGGAAPKVGAKPPAAMPRLDTGKAYVRHNVTSPEGRRMLAKYAVAVKRMRELPDHDTQSWNFWWYTHWIKGPPAHMWEESKAHKEQVLALLPPDARALADAAWNGCQAHPYNPDRPAQYQQWFFLPWHRLYLHQFEQTVRRVLNDDDFSLPYWNAESGDVADLALPAPFRDPASPLFNETRNPYINAGDRLDTPFRNWLTLDALSEEFFNDSATGGIGFNTRLDINPHFLTHVSIGGDMGNFATVGRDPIFYLHHANLDRVWESWNRLGKSNPTESGYLDRTFTFAGPDGRRVDPAVRSADRTALLGYAYDSYSVPPRDGPKSPDSVARASLAVAAEPASSSRGAYRGPFGNSRGGPTEAVRVSLKPAAGAKPDAAAPTRSLSVPAGRSYQGPFGNSKPAVRTPEPSRDREGQKGSSSGPNAPTWTLPDATGRAVSLDQYRGRPVVVIFYRGAECLACMEQLDSFGKKAREFAAAGVELVAVSADTPEALAKAQAPYRDRGGFPIRLVSDAGLGVFRDYRCVDFDGSPLHGTFLVDRRGLVRWRDIGDEPFGDPAFVLARAKSLSDEVAR